MAISKKELIPMDDMGIFANAKYEMLIDSRKVAEYFEKPHDQLIRSIRRIIDEDKSGYSEGFRLCNFAETSYIDEWNRKQLMYLMTRDGFTAVAMGFTGKKADVFKEAYIKRFNEMEQQIASLQHLREQFKPLTDAIQEAHENPKAYHFSNEADMLNRIAFGMSAKQFREAHNLQKADPIRPHLTPMQAALLDRLQTIDVGFVLSVPDFELRKRLLQQQKESWVSKNAHKFLGLTEIPCIRHDELKTV